MNEEAAEAEEEDQIGEVEAEVELDQDTAVRNCPQHYWNRSIRLTVCIVGHLSIARRSGKLPGKRQELVDSRLDPVRLNRLRERHQSRNPAARH